MFYGAHSEWSVTYQDYSVSLREKKRKNYSSSDVDEDITKIQTGEISQAKDVCKYGILCQTLVRTFKNKTEKVSDNRTGPTPVVVNLTEKDLVQWSLFMKK